MIQIGRVGRGVPLPEPKTWSYEGGRLSLSGLLSADTVEDCRALRDQMAGLAGNVDEPTVPFLWDRQPEWLGMYRPEMVSVSQGLSELAAKAIPWQARLVRSGRRVESRLSWGARQNVHGIKVVDTSPLHFVPYETTGYSDGLGGTTEVAASGGILRWVDDGDGDIGLVRGYELSTSAAGARASWGVDPRYWYRGACTIRSNGRIVMGREMPADTGNNWEISSGLIRCRVTSDRFRVDVFTGTAWTGREIDLSWLKQGAPGTLDRMSMVPLRADVVRNSPECCVLQVAMVATSSRMGEMARHYTLTITISRGAHVARFVWATDAAVMVGTEVKPASSGAFTNVVGGFQTTGAPIMSAVTGLQTSNGIYLTADQRVIPFGVGLSPTFKALPPTSWGEPATVLNTPADVRKQYWAAGGETMSVVV